MTITLTPREKVLTRSQSRNLERGTSSCVNTPVRTDLVDHFETLSVSHPSTGTSLGTHRSTQRRRRSSGGISSTSTLPSSPTTHIIKRKETLHDNDVFVEGGPLKDTNCHSKSSSSGSPIRSGCKRSRKFLAKEREERRTKKVLPLPGREQEFEMIYERLADAVRLKQGICIYVSGVPGTGKTATVRQSIEFMQQPQQRKKIGQFSFVEINGMRLTDASQSYVILWRHISGKTVSGNLALKKLDSHFASDQSKIPMVVLLDELDLLLVRKNSAMLYHFFEWTGWQTARLAIVAIANTMDLPERFLPNRVASRMGSHRINFKPYTYPQLMMVIAHHQADWKDLFHPDALEYCARKVSAVSGDARRALSLARRTVEWIRAGRRLPSTGNSGLITIPAVERAVQMAMAGNPVQLAGALSMQERTFLLALILAGRTCGSSWVAFGRVCEHHWQLLRTGSQDALSYRQLQQILESLQRQRLVVIATDSDHHRQMIVYQTSLIKLGVPEEEIVIALRQTAAFQKHL